MVQQPIPPTPVDPHDDNVEDDSLLRPITAPPERDRAQAKYGDSEIEENMREVDHAMDASGARATLIVPLVIVAVVVIALLLFWLL